MEIICSSVNVSGLYVGLNGRHDLFYDICFHFCHIMIGCLLCLHF